LYSSELKNVFYNSGNFGHFLVMRKIAVVGCGVSGLSCAWGLLEGTSDVHISLFEKNDYLGGHTNTVDVEHKVCVR
jgi:predicted NAD/FAD-binding protein